MDMDGRVKYVGNAGGPTWSVRHAWCACRNEYPGGRDSAVSWTDSSGNFWLFGGETAEYYNDLWHYQP